MKNFPAWDSYWRFAHSVRTERRYLLTKEARTFLNAVRVTAERRSEALGSDVRLWRAQLGASTIEIPLDGPDDFAVEDYPFDEKRMKPRPGRAREGRANPKGIPFLYLATHKETAAAEVRPWKGGVVSVGQFQPVRELKLVNTTLRSKKMFFIGRQPSPLKREEAVWGYIDHAFSEPTTLSDDATEYVPTQVLSELFRDAGYDGIGYRSAYGPGHNIVLFDTDIAKQVNCFVMEVKDIKFQFELNEQFAYRVKAKPA
jgi:hypothetical protein